MLPDTGRHGGDQVDDALKTLGLGLSRLLRYSFGGFLLLASISVFRSDLAKQAHDALGWELVGITALVIGAGVYAAHRCVIVPVHHSLMCLTWWGIDKLRGKTGDHSANPTRFLGHLGVHWVWQISAYTVLRRSSAFEKEKRDWDLAHAESGLVLMSSEALLLSGYYATTLQTPPVHPEPLLWSGGILFVLSFAGFVQHAVECLLFKERQVAVKTTLQDLGFIDCDRVNASALRTGNLT
jgi:hypothetical protein